MTTKGGIAFLLIPNLQCTLLSQIHKFQPFNTIIEGFLIVFSGKSVRRSNMAAPNFRREVYFLSATFFLKRRREKVTVGGGGGAISLTGVYGGCSRK